jgi:ABC-type transport system involved in multi-copper enzyme maturation permease subunit
VIVYITQHYDLATFPNVLKGTSFILLSAGWLLGASAIGADWHTGHITTILSWEPRRGRLIWAKVAAALVQVFVISLVLQAVLGLVLAVVAAAKGSTAGVDAAWLTSSLEVALRVGLLSSLFGAIGFGLASVGRNSAVALGVGFGYLVVVENLVRGLRPGWIKWLLTENTALVVTADPTIGITLNGRSTLGAAVYIAAICLLMLLVATVLFRVRDVT